MLSKGDFSALDSPKMLLKGDLKHLKTLPERLKSSPRASRILPRGSRGALWSIPGGSESSPNAPQRVPGSALEHSWRSRIAPKSSISLNMTLLGLKKRIPEASGPSFGAFWRPQGLVLDPLRLVLIDDKIRRAARPTGVLDAKPTLGILN